MSDLTIGDRNGTTRTLLGRTWRCDDGIQMLAEYDIVELERFADEMLDLNRESSLAQNALIRESVTMKQRERWILEASLTDALTGLGNRRRLDQALATEISRTRRAGGLLSALMLDIDHFKCINDTYGHSVGDTVLARVGALLRSHTRPTDIVTRFGGEEFVVLMPDAGLAQAAVKAELLRTMLAAEMMGPITSPVTSSFGVAQLTPGEDGETFLKRIDAALYRAKDGGRNRVVVAQSDPHP